MKFSIRDVLWLTVVVALAVCWGIDRVQFRRELVEVQQAELRARNEAELALYASGITQAHADAARAMEAQIRTIATPDPQADQPPATTAP